MSKPQDFFPYKSGTLSVEGLPLDQIADQFGTPLYVYSANAFLKPLHDLQKGLTGLDHVICFAAKSNSNIAIIKLLSDAGAGADIVSGGELFRAEAAGVPAERIVFSGVGKTPGEMLQALEYQGRGIFSFNVESIAELATLNSVAEQADRVASVALRFNPDVDAKTHPYISTGLKKNKFGLNRKEILTIAKNIGDYPHIAFKGISVHIGSQLLSLSPLKDAFSRARDLIDELAEILPEPLSYVDLGGGLGITYKNEKSPDIKTYCEIIHRLFGKKAKLKRPMKLFLEPGRRIAGNSGVLLSEILYRKDRTSKDFLIVDAAMNDLLRPSLYGSYHEIVPVNKKSGKSKKVDVVGPVCETGDYFARDRSLPANLDQGDLIAILSAGAYGFTMSGNYNSRPRTAEVLVHQGKVRLIREREDYEDLIRGETL